ncbi:hypothetical protein [Mesobacillus boroniphilus]|nr:hypothetical protein [Mesobacillus boroniphilus]
MKEFKKEYRSSIESVIKLLDSSGFAVVLSHLDYGKRNAFILNADGRERFNFSIPTEIRDAICFHEIYYLNGVLIAIVATRSVDYACVIDPNSGNLTKFYETR